MSLSQRRSPLSSALWLLALALATFALYACGLNIWYYGDDFQYVFENPAERIFYFFSHPNLYHSFYRPVNSAIIAVVQVVWGRETWPIHVVSIVVHAVLAWLVYRFMVREKFSRSAALAGSLFMVVSQANAGAVHGNDTFSQISGTFFGCLALWALYRGYYREPGKPAVDVPFPWPQYVMAMVWLVPCLASKETSVSFLPMIGLLLLVKNFKLPTWGGRILRTALETAPFLAITLAYIALRAAIGLSQPTSDSHTYGFRLGFNVLRNLLQFIVAAIIPTSTADFYVAVQMREFVMLTLSALGCLAFVAMVMLGLRRAPRHRSLLLLGAFALLGLFPAMLMNHVGELYLYNSMPFIAVIVGVGIGAAWDNAMTSRGRRLLVGGLLLVLAASHAWAIQTKAVQMKANGERARTLLPQLARLAEGAPVGARMFLVSPPDSGIEYSVYLMNGFAVFKWGDHVIGQEAKRPDVDVDVIDPGMQVPAVPRDRMVMVTLRGGSAVVLDTHAVR